MKKLLILALIILSIFLIYYIFNNNKKVYSAVGDFYANGINSDNNYRYGYPDYMKDIYKEKDELKYFDKSYINDNYSITKMLQDIKYNDFKIENGKTISLKKTLREADILTITIGFNDLLDKLEINDIKNLEYTNQSIINNKLSEVKNDLNKLILEIKKYSKKDIILVGYCFKDKKNYPNINYISQELDNIYQEVATKNKIINISSIKKLNTYNTNDNIYPNYKMYKDLANKIIKELA